jgi:ATP-dependent DNA helicase RecG
MSERLESIKGVGPQLVRKFALLGIHSVQDLIAYLPRAYNDFSVVTQIANIKPGVVTVEAKLKSVTGRYVRRGLHITEAVATDASGSVRIVWFNQPFRATTLKDTETYYVSGEFGLSRQRMTLMNPTTELVSALPVHTARIVPIYRETKGLSSSMIRKTVHTAFMQGVRLAESLPTWLIDGHHLIDRHKALYSMHFPENGAALARAKRRLGFEEVFYLTLASLMNKQEFAKEHALKIPFDSTFAKDFVSKLPFSLTDDQRKVLWRIFQDMESSVPMNRLVEGDVGSGKTVVAAMAACMAMKAGLQVAYMAPTELLARQHAESLYAVLEPLGMGSKVGLLIGALKPSQKKIIHTQVKTGTIQFIVGTHALFSDSVVMHNLGLVVVDEQHRFGVEQRKKLQSKAHVMPHVLSMTATPIPRSLALTLYGELDISVIEALPAGRKITKTVIASPNSRSSMYEKVKSELDAGRQAFVVCPLITDSEDIKSPSAEKMFATLSKKELKDYRVGLLHGKMKPEEKDVVMQKFIKHEVDVLVATTVIEVGVNVPNATVMIIEGADRFGLAQMHQLRGRVGRSEHQAYCYIVPSDSRAPSSRLRALATTYDGFKLSELDLELRGPGAIYGTMQSGALDLRVAKLSDTKLVSEARDAAAEFLAKGENLLHYPVVNKHVQKIRTITNLN